MAVYDRAWRRYSGQLTPARWRFLVITQYALRDTFSTRAFAIFYLICSLPSVAALLTIYALNNLEKIELLSQFASQLPADKLSMIIVEILRWLFLAEAIPAFFLAVIVSPSLIAADLSRNAIPMYLSRPIGRRDYILGKMAVLVLLMSPVTWMASLSLYGMQSFLAGNGWWYSDQHYRLAFAHLLGHLAWIVMVSLMSLAVSAWVRYKWLARGVLFGLFMISAGFSALLNALLGTKWGSLLNLQGVINVIVRHLFGTASGTGIPAWSAWLSLITITSLSLLLLARKVQAQEVVR